MGTILTWIVKTILETIVSNLALWFWGHHRAVIALVLALVTAKHVALPISTSAASIAVTVRTLSASGQLVGQVSSTRADGLSSPCPNVLLVPHRSSAA